MATEKITRAYITETLSLKSGFTGSTFLCKNGHVVQFKIDCSGTLSKNAWTTLAELPVGFRPPAQFDFVGVDNTGNNSGVIQCKCHNNGNVHVYALNANGNDVRIVCTYIVE